MQQILKLKSLVGRRETSFGKIKADGFENITISPSSLHRPVLGGRFPDFRRSHFGLVEIYRTQSGDYQLRAKLHNSQSSHIKCISSSLAMRKGFFFNPTILWTRRFSLILTFFWMMVNAAVLWWVARSMLPLIQNHFLTCHIRLKAVKFISNRSKKGFLTQFLFKVHSTPFPAWLLSVWFQCVHKPAWGDALTHLWRNAIATAHWPQPILKRGKPPRRKRMFYWENHRGEK